MSDMYQFAPDFERGVIYHLAANKPVFLHYGPHIHDHFFSSDTTRLLWKAMQSIFIDIDDAPGGPAMVEQRVQAMLNTGQVKHEAAAHAMFYLSEACESPPPFAELGPELASMVKAYARYNLVNDMAKAVGTRKSLLPLKEMLEKIESIGQEEAGAIAWGAFDDDMFQRFADAKKLDRMSTGITELDVFLDGGYPRRTLTVVIGGTGVGKSFFLSQAGATAVKNGLNVMYITLEIPEIYVSSRMAAPLLGMKSADIMAQPMQAKEQARTFFSDNPSAGRWLVGHFAPKTTVQKVREEVNKITKRTGFKPDVILFDYIGEAASHTINQGQAGSAFSGYLMGGAVATELRAWADEENLYMLSAAQSKRKQTPGKRSRLTLDDIADSMNVVRVADIALTLNYTESEETEGAKSTRLICLGVPKHRVGRSGDHTVEKAAQYEYGLIYPSELFSFSHDIGAVYNYDNFVKRKGVN